MNKKDIMMFFEKAKAVADGSGEIIDRVTNISTGIYDKMYKHGDFVWYLEQVYHYAKYNILLTKEFVDFATSLENV